MKIKKPLIGMSVYTYSDLCKEHPNDWNIVYSHSSADGTMDYYKLFDENGTEMAYPSEVWSDECAEITRNSLA